MPHDDLGHIPSIVPRRDTEVQMAIDQRTVNKAKRSKKGGKSSSGGSSAGGGTGIWARLFITLSLVVAAVACAWAWQLQEQLAQSSYLMEQAGRRIGDLEDRLADTDEGLSQNTAAMAVKISESELEIRKLWDDRKQINPKISVLQSKTTANAKKIASTEKSLNTANSKLKSASTDLAKLKSVSGDLSRLINSAKANQAEVERVADDMNRINLDFSKLSKRVKGNEEWVGPVNAFRGTTNAALTRMQADIRALQTAP